MVHRNRIEVLKTENALGFRLAETEFSEIVELELMPQGAIEAHALPINVVFYVISGQGVITINNDSFRVQTGDVIEVSAKSQRAWKNNSNEILKLLVIKQKS